MLVLPCWLSALPPAASLSLPMPPALQAVLPAAPPVIPLKSPTRGPACTTLADAAALTGYDFTVPDSVDGYPDVTIAVLESEQLTEVQYSSGNARLCLRKAPGSDDISGDFNQYAESNAVDVDGRSVTLQGNDGQVQLATWLDGDYTYSIGIYREDGTGLTADEMTGLVKAAK